MVKRISSRSKIVFDHYLLVTFSKSVPRVSLTHTFSKSEPISLGVQFDNQSSGDNQLILLMSRSDRLTVLIKQNCFCACCPYINTNQIRHLFTFQKLHKVCQKTLHLVGGEDITLKLLSLTDELYPGYH